PDRDLSGGFMPAEYGPPPGPGSGVDRRRFLKGSATMSVAAGTLVAERAPAQAPPRNPRDPVKDTLNVNGQRLSLSLDIRTTLLDALREHAGLTGTKKGCDQ